MVTVSAGQTITITCSATGRPPPDITWVKNGSLITTEEIINTMSSDSGISISSLTISNVTLQTAGEYICNASNELVTVLWSSSEESNVRILCKLFEIACTCKSSICLQQHVVMLLYNYTVLLFIVYFVIVYCYCLLILLLFTVIVY